MPRSRSSARQLNHLLESIPHPVYVLDEGRRIVYVNSAGTDWLGVEADQLVGTRCDYAPAEKLQAPTNVATALCPPPEVFHGQRCTAWVHVDNAQGEAVWRRGEFVPMGTDANEFCGLIAVLEATDESREPPGDPTYEPSARDLHHRLQTLTSQFRSRFRLERLVGESAVMHRVRQQVQLAIDGRSRVVIVGPPGSGREQVARTIHVGSQPDSAGPLMPLSCSLLDAELLQTTVVAFLRRCQDLTPENPASLLLLDVDQLSPDAQAELLAFFRVPTFGLRTIVTAEKSLMGLADEEQFLRDLALSLSVQIIELPGLADRRQDIPFLTQQLLEEHNERGGRQFGGFSADAIDQLASMPWPGNITELTAVVSEAIDNSAGPLITLAELPQRVRVIHSAAAYPIRETESIVLDDFLGEIERELIQRALRQARGNKAAAARLLGIHRARLLRRITQLGLESAE